jgi:hypothetical protein
VSYLKVGQKTFLGVSAMLSRVNIFSALAQRIFCLMDTSNAPASGSLLGNGLSAYRGALASCQDRVVSLRRTQNVLLNALLSGNKVLLIMWKTFS